MNKILKGDMYYATLDPVMGSEQGGSRAVLIIQNNIGNLFGPTVIVAPISKKKYKLPTHVDIHSVHKIKYNSTILVEQTRTIDKRRLGQFLGRITSDKMRKVNRSIMIAFGLSKESSLL